jgi:hypothetical protein
LVKSLLLAEQYGKNLKRKKELWFFNTVEEPELFVLDKGELDPATGVLLKGRPAGNFDEGIVGDDKDEEGSVTETLALLRLELTIGTNI